MKIEAKSPVFRPVTITIETKEEFSLLYHLLNNSPASVPFPKYCEINDLHFDDNTAARMCESMYKWWELNSMGELI